MTILPATQYVIFAAVALLLSVLQAQQSQAANPEDVVDATHRDLAGPPSPPDELWTTTNYGINIANLNTTNGKATQIGLNYTFPYRTLDTLSLAFDDRGVLYTIVHNYTDNTNRLGTINTTTGIGMVLPGAPDIKNGALFSGLEISCNGAVHAVDELAVPPALYLLNKTDGSVMSTTNITNTHGSIFELAFSTSGVLWAINNNTYPEGPELFTIALPSGVASSKGVISGDYPNLTSGNIGGIAFDHRGTLYATDNLQFATLYDVDTLTLHATSVGKLGGWGAFPVGLDTFPGECLAALPSVIPSSRPSVMPSSGATTITKGNLSTVFMGCAAAISLCVSLF